MIEVAGGILLALLVLLCIPMLLRSIAALFPICALLLLGAFFLGTSFGRTLLPGVVVVGGFAAVVWGVSKGLDYRDAVKRGKAGWHFPGR